MIDKNELRKKAKNIRINLPMGKISAQLVNLIRTNEYYIKANNIMIFYPVKYDDKKFYLPKVNGSDILICPYCSELKKSDLGIYEPCSQPVNSKVLDLVIVPALMADRQGYRLGYGGGFYDRFIEKHGQNFKTLCPIPKELFTEKLPVEKYDKKTDIVITTI